MNDLIFSVLLFFGIFLIFASSLRFSLNGRLTVFQIFSIFFSIAYLVTPSVQHFIPSAIGEEALLAQKHSQGKEVLSALAVTIGYGGVLVAYVIGMKINVGRGYRRLVEIDYRKFAWISLAASCLFIALYVSQYGGLAVALRNAAAIRAGAGEDLLEGGGYLLFAKYLIPVGAFGVLASIVMKLEQGRLNIVLLCFAVLVVGAGFLLMAGRNRFLALFVAAAIVYFDIVRPKNLLKPARLASFFLIAIVGYFVLIYGKIFFSSMAQDSFFDAFSERVASADGGGIRGLSNFEHHFASIGVALEYVYDLNGPRYFVDVLNAPISVIPSRLFGVSKPTPVSVPNTEMITGERDSRIPPGLIGFGIYSLGYFGILIVMSGVGFGLAFLDRVIRKGGGYRIVAAWAAVTFVVSGGTGDPRVLMYALLPTVLAVALAWMSKVRRAA